MEWSLDRFHCGIIFVRIIVLIYITINRVNYYKSLRVMETLNIIDHLSDQSQL